MSKHLGAALILFAFAPAGAQEIQMYQSKTIQFRRAKEVQPNQSAPAPTPFQAQEIKPVQAESIEPYQAKTIQNQPTNPSEQTAANPSLPADPTAFMGTWSTFVPGAVYETPSNQPGWNVLHVSAGAKSSQLKLTGNGKYQWGNVSGRWDKTGEADYPIVLRKAKNGRDWKIGWANPRPGKPRELVIWDGSTWYNANKLK